MPKAIVLIHREEVGFPGEMFNRDTVIGVMTQNTNETEVEFDSRVNEVQTRLKNTTILDQLAKSPEFKGIAAPFLGDKHYEGLIIVEGTEIL